MARVSVLITTCVHPTPLVLGVTDSTTAITVDFPGGAHRHGESMAHAAARILAASTGISIPEKNLDLFWAAKDHAVMTPSASWQMPDRLIGRPFVGVASFFLPGDIVFWSARSSETRSVLERAGLL